VPSSPDRIDDAHLDPDFVKTYADREVPWGFNGLGYVVYKRTYARPLSEEGRTEEWHETVERAVNGAIDIGAGLTPDEAERLFDYIFTPLTTSRGWFRNRVSIALLLTFLASGLWHGGAWTFVLWGALHGLGMVVHTGWDERYRAWCRTNRSLVALRRSKPYALFAWSLTLAFFLLTLVPFRAEGLGAAWTFLGGMGAGSGQLSVQVGVNAGLALAFVAAYHVLALPGVALLRTRIAALPDAVRGFAYGSALVFLLLQTPPGTGAFIYQQF